MEWTIALVVCMELRYSCSLLSFIWPWYSRWKEHLLNPNHNNNSHPPLYSGSTLLLQQHTSSSHSRASITFQVVVSSTPHQHTHSYHNPSSSKNRLVWYFKFWMWGRLLAIGHWTSHQCPEISDDPQMLSPFPPTRELEEGVYLMATPPPNCSNSLAEAPSPSSDPDINRSSSPTAIP